MAENQAGVRHDSAKLRKVLVTLFPTASDIQRVASDAGVPTARVEFAGSAEQIWFNLLKEAQLCERLDALCDVARQEYPNVRALWESDPLDALLQRRAQTNDRADVAALDQQIAQLARARRQGPTLQIGECLFGRYLLMQALGEGGFATVWRAWDHQRRCDVAVKVLHSHLANSASRVAHFKQGAAAMERLRHENIVRIAQPYVVEEGFHYFVMQYVDSEDLQRAARPGRFTLEQKLALITTVGGAISYAHGEKIIHRDIKPANILLTQDGAPMLTDFDLARVSDSMVTSQSSQLGAMYFVAPEVTEPGAPVDERTDIYALAMTALFLLREGALSMRLLQDRAATVRELCCPPHVARAIEASIALDASSRPSSVREFCRMLQGDPAPAVPRERPSIRPVGDSPPWVGPRPAPSRVVPSTIPPRPPVELASPPDGAARPMREVAPSTPPAPEPALRTPEDLSTPPPQSVSIFRAATRPPTGFSPPQTMRSFVLYHQHDHALCEHVVQFLSTFESRGILEGYHDRIGLPAAEWPTALRHRMARADVVFFLIRDEALESLSDATQQQLAHVLAKHREGNARLVPILVQRVAAPPPWFQQVKVLPEGELPLTDWDDEHEAWSALKSDLDRLVQEFYGERFASRLYGHA